MKDEPPGKVQWIDHFVVCTADAERWRAFHTKVLGATTVPEDQGVPLRFGYFLNNARCRIGGFISRTALPPTRGLGTGLPRYAFYVHAADLGEHLRRLDEAGAVHGDAIRTTGEGESGTAISWQDPDGNQFEFWAPDALPEGAMVECGPERIGRISHAVYESRDLDRTAAFFERFCALERSTDANIAPDMAVFRLAASGRIVYRLTGELQGRTTGCGLQDAHTALLVRGEDIVANYKRLWAALPEWDFDAVANGGKPIENPGALPARTVLHISPAGRRFKEITGRGDDFLDWDTNMFHFFGGTPVSEGMAVYTTHSIDHYIDDFKPASFHE